MESVIDLWHRFLDFLLKYDFRTLAKMVYSIDWHKLSYNPISWLAAAIVMIAIIISKRYKYLLLIASIALMFFVFYKTVPENPEEIEFQKLLVFMFSSIAIVGVNIYFFMMRK